VAKYRCLFTYQRGYVILILDEKRSSGVTLWVLHERIIWCCPFHNIQYYTPQALHFRTNKGLSNLYGVHLQSSLIWLQIHIYDTASTSPSSTYYSQASVLQLNLVTHLSWWLVLDGPVWRGNPLNEVMLMKIHYFHFNQGPTISVPEEALSVHVLPKSPPNSIGAYLSLYTCYWIHYSHITCFHKSTAPYSLII
jgi:hypothetical protein